MKKANLKRSAFLLFFVITAGALLCGCDGKNEGIDKTAQIQETQTTTSAIQSDGEESLSPALDAPQSSQGNEPIFPSLAQEEKGNESFLQFQADLDGDGKNETCEIFYTGDGLRAIRINDKDIEIEDYAANDITYQIVDIDKNDGLKEIAYYSAAYSAEIDISEYVNTPSFTQFIRWNGDTILNLGAVRGIPNESKTACITIPGDGIVTGVTSSWIMTEVYYRLPYQVNRETNVLEPISKDAYDYAIVRKCRVIRPFQGYEKMDIKANRLNLTEGEQLTLDKTDGRAWVHFETETGKTGWMKIAPDYFPRIKGEDADDELYLQKMNIDGALAISPFQSNSKQDRDDKRNHENIQEFTSPTYRRVLRPFTVYVEPNEMGQSYQVKEGEIIMSDSAFLSDEFDIKWVHGIDQKGNTLWICMVSSDIQQNRAIGGYGDYADYLRFTDAETRDCGA